MSWVTRAWFSVPVVVKRSNEMPSFCHDSRNCWWYLAAISPGLLPSCSALMVIGVPCWSEPETISTSFPLVR